MMGAGQRVRVVAGENAGDHGTVEGEYGVHHFGCWVLIDGQDEAEAYEYFEIEALA